MNNDEILKHIQEMINSDCFANNAAFQNYIKQTAISVPIIVQVFNDLFDSLFVLITDSMDFIAEQFNKLIEELADDLSEVTPRVKHLALCSKKIRVRKKNYKRLWKRQKIP